MGNKVFEKYRMLADNKLGARILINSESKILFANDNFLFNFLGNNPDNIALTAQNLDIVFNMFENGKQKFFSEIIKEAASQNSISVQLLFKPDCGKEIFVDFNAVLLNSEDDILLGVFSKSNKNDTSDLMQFSLKNYRETFNAASEAIFICDPENGNILDVNSAALDLFGYSYLDIFNINPDDLIRGSENNCISFSGLIKSTEFAGLQFSEMTARNKNNKKIWIEISTKFYRTNNIKRVIAIIRDISQRKDSEKYIKDNELKYRTLFETANDAIIIIKDFVIVDCNIKALELLKCSHHEIISHSPFEFFSVESEKGINSARNTTEKINKALTGETQFFEWINRKKDGTLFDTEVSLNNIIVGEDNYLQAIIRDVSERKKYEKSLIESENKFRDFAEKSIIGIFLIQDGVFKYMNQKLIQILGFERNDDNDKLKLQDIIHSEDLEVVSNNFENNLAGTSNYINSDFRCIKKNKQIIHVEIYGSRTFFNENPAVVGSLIDVTERKKIEMAVMAAKEEAEKSNKLKSEFLAQISHEIRTPVNSILSYAGLIKEELEENIPVELAQSFSIMNRAGKRIIRTIDLILNMSQLHTGTFEYIPTKFDIYGRVLDNLYLEYKKIAAEKNLNLYLDCQKEETYNIFADEYTVYQIFVNLIDNAIKYTDKGSIRILLGRDNENNIFVEVADTGIGIKEEYLPHIFDAFTQEDQGYTRKFEGNGLGLALVKEYCRLNKALINVKSEKGIGSTFKVTFI